MTAEGRYQRKARRAEATRWENTRLSSRSRSWLRWMRSLQNTKAYDEYGFHYYAYNRPALIHKGRKP